MPDNLLLQTNNEADSNLYTRGGYEKKKLVTIAVVACLLIIGVVVLGVFQYRHSNYTRAATVAARKDTPNAKVSDLVVAGGFALSRVRDPNAVSQIKYGNTTVFKVNEDGSMTQIASGSSFSPLDLLQLGIPLETRAKLTKNGLSQVKQNLAGSCGYSGGNEPGYVGFGGSFDPGGWEIDSGTMNSLKRSITATISNKNAKAETDNKIICINATHKNSNFTTDMKTYISTFALELQFVTDNGTLTTHKFTFTTGSKHNSYTIDGQRI